MGKQRERLLRDQEIRKKEREENLAKGGDGNVDDADREVGETGWGKGGARQTAAQNSPPKRDREGGMGGGFNITRSDKPRNTNTDEEKKSERPSFTRGPKREDAPDTGFARGNFTKKTEVDAKKDDSPKKTERPARGAPAEGGSGFGGFRNNNTARKGPPK